MKKCDSQRGAERYSKLHKCISAIACRFYWIYWFRCIALVLSSCSDSLGAIFFLLKPYECNEFFLEIVIRLLEQTEHSPGLLASKHDCQTTNSIPLWINEKSDCQPRDERFTKLHMQAYLQWHADCTDWFRCIVLLLNSSKTASTPHLNDNHRLTAIYFLRIPITLMRGLRAEGLRSNGVMELHDPYTKSCPVEVDDKKMVVFSWPKVGLTVAR